jgi:hypothetical protein
MALALARHPKAVSRYACHGTSNGAAILFDRLHPEGEPFLWIKMNYPGGNMTSMASRSN